MKNQTSTTEPLLIKFSKVSNITIDQENHNQRLDNFLFRLFHKKILRSQIYELIRTGQVRINKSRIKHNYKIKLHDVLRIPPIQSLYHKNKFNNSKIIINQYKLPINDQENQKNSKKSIIPTAIKHSNTKFLSKLKIWQQKLKSAIIFENQDLLIINKPAGLAVHGGSKINIGLLEILKNLRPTEHFLELVHRLDKDTSGCIMLAKKRSYLKKLHALLKASKITKIYSVLVKGKLIKKTVINLPLKKIITNSREHVVKVTTEGAVAKTICIPEKHFHLNNINFSLIQAKPLTGKTHQIRVHLANEGFPIINDVKYGDRAYNNFISNLGLTRMFLHAKSLEFICPNTNEAIFVEAKYDESLNNFLLKLENICG